MCTSVRSLFVVCIASLIQVGLAQATFVAYTDAGVRYGGCGGNLNIGRQFDVTNDGITVSDLGVWDYQGNGLLDSHVITLFSLDWFGRNPPATVLPGGSVTVSSGTAATLDSGFRFAPLAERIYLPAGKYSVVVYGLNSDGRDPYGDGGGYPNPLNNVTDYRFDPFQFTDAVSPAYPSAGDGLNHSSASFRFEMGPVVPEPSTFMLLALGGLSAWIWVRRSSRNA